MPPGTPILLALCRRCGCHLGARCEVQGLVPQFGKLARAVEYVGETWAERRKQWKWLPDGCI